MSKEERGGEDVLANEVDPRPTAQRPEARSVQGIVQRARHHLDPAISLVVSYLGLLANDAGLGGMSVWWDDEKNTIDRQIANLPQNASGPEIAELAAETRMFPSGMRRFCSLVQRSQEGYDRCHACDIKWIGRATRTRRSQIYQCHAGLTDIVVPIIVRGKYVGRILTGQLVHHRRLPGGFSDVWVRIQDIQGLDREEMAEAFHELGGVDESDLRELIAALEGAARSLGDLWESMLSLVVQEKQLARMHTYLERDFAESILNGGILSERDALIGARGWGSLRVWTGRTRGLSIRAQPRNARSSAFLPTLYTRCSGMCPTHL